MLPLFLVSLTAHADTLWLDNDATLQGELAVYEPDGACQISMTQGDLAGAIVIVPCSRITRFERGPGAAKPRSLAEVEVEDRSLDMPAAAPALEDDLEGVALDELVSVDRSLLRPDAPDAVEDTVEQAAAPDDGPAPRIAPSLWSEPRQRSAAPAGTSYQLHHAPEDLGPL